MKRFHLSDLREIDVKYLVRRMRSSLTEQWYLKGDRASEDRRRLLMSTYANNIMANFIGGSFWAGLLLLLNADDGFIGLMSMIATGANMLQMLAPLFLERFVRRKKMIIIVRCIIQLVNILLIGLIPLFPAGRQMSLTMTAIAILTVNVLSALISPGISIWHIQSIPPNVRTSFYSLITMTVGAVVAVFNLLGSRLVDVFKAAGMEYSGLLALRLIALAIAVYDIVLYSKVEEYPYEGGDGKKFTIKDLLIRPFKERTYLRTVGVAFLWSLAANIPGMYFTVYLLEDVNVPYSYLMLVSMLNVPVVLFLTPAWRKVLHRFSWFKTLYLAMALYLVHYVGMAFVTVPTLWMYPLFAIWAYVMAIGINLSFTAIPYVNMPQKNQTMFIGFYSTMANMAALLGITFGRNFVLWMEPVKLNILGVMMGNRQLILLLTAVVMAAAVAGVWALQRSMPKPEC